MTPAVVVRGLVVKYGSVTALDGVSFTLESGLCLGIVGPNGSGKSTLLKAVGGLIEPAAGEVEVFGRRAGTLAPGTVGYVPQIEEVDWSFPASVWDVVAMGRFPKMRIFARFSKRDRTVVREALAAVGMEQFAQRHISELSGGQQQRVFVARAIALEPRLLLLDEPTTGVDARTEDALMHLIRSRVAAGMPVLMTTHDLDRASDWFDRLMVVDRRVLAVGDPETVLESGAYAGIREHTHTHGHARVDVV